MLIIEFQPNRVLLSLPAQWWISYKDKDEIEFKKIAVTSDILIMLLEQYGIETNDILELSKFGVNTKNIKHNIYL